MRLQTILCLYTWTTPILNALPRGGTHAHSSPWLSQILTTPPSTPLAVCQICPSQLAASHVLLSDAHHRFIAEECDWGFTRFSELRKLFSVQDGHTRPTIEDEAAEVSVFVRVLEDPTGVLWHNFVK